MEKLGKYQIVEKIGVGGFGVVYKGFDPFIKRHVAIKTCSVEDTETRERFRREAEISGNLQHRNIVTVFEFGFEADVPFLVQEYLSGEDLDRKIKRNDYVPLPEKILWLVQIARGLEFAHTRGIVHRDIKPANIRILDDGTAKILDFGIAKLAHHPSHLTQAGITLGTAAYLSPEQIRGQPVDARADVFSFGVLAYELLAFERPFRAPELSAIFYKILNEKPEPLAARVPDVSVDLDRIIERCLEKDPARRWSPTTGVVRALEAMMQRRPGSTTLGGTTLEGARTQVVSRSAEVKTTIVPRPVAAKPRLDDLEFRHSDATPRVQSRSMATSSYGAARPRGWLKWLGAIGAAAALGAVALFVLREAGGGASTGDGGTPPEVAAAPAAGPATTSTPTPAGAPAPAPAAPPAAPPVEPPPPPEPPKPGRIVVGPAWSPEMQVRVGGRRIRLDREQRLELEPGTHTLSFSVSTPDYSFSAQRKVKLEAGAQQRVQIPIEKPGRLTVQPHLNTRPGTIRVDGQVAGPSPVRGRWLQPGEHLVEVAPVAAAPGAPPALSRRVPVRSDVETVVTFDVDGAIETQVRERPLAP